MASIATARKCGAWVSAHRKLARLPSELRNASISVCSCRPTESCAKETTSAESRLELPNDVEGRAKLTRSW